MRLVGHCGIQLGPVVGRAGVTSVTRFRWLARTKGKHGHDRAGPLKGGGEERRGQDGPVDHDGGSLDWAYWFVVAS
jgi:hypothetical protein